GGLGLVRPRAGVPGPLGPRLDATLRGYRGRVPESARRVTWYGRSWELCRERIGRFWSGEAAIVHPPVEIERFRVGEPEEFFLIVSEVVRHKRLPLALEAATRAGKRVVVVGDGPELRALRASYRDGHEFLRSVGAA